MVYPIFVIKDNKIGFMMPQCDNNDATALRNLRVAMADSHSVMRLHARDFALYRIGTFDTESGHIDALDTPEFIADALNIAKEFDDEL